MSDRAPGSGPEAADVPSAEPGSAAEPAPTGGFTEFPLDDWSGEDRALLDRLLVAGDIPRAWQGGTVVVPVARQHDVDDLIDQVEMSDQLLAPGPGGPRSTGDGESAIAVLDRSSAHEPGTGEASSWDDDDWDDDVDAQEVLGEAFLAADRLRRRARDPEGVLALVEAGDTLATMGLPFGFDRAVWDDLVAHVAALATALTVPEGSSDDPGDEGIEELADDLRARLRPLV